MITLPFSPPLTGGGWGWVFFYFTSTFLPLMMLMPF